MGMNLLLSLFVLTVAGADGDKENKMDAASQQALVQTQQLLKDPKARKEAMAKDPKAKATDENVKRVAGSEENSEEMYDLSADIMETITKQANGDPEKMQNLVMDALKDPAAFAARFSPAQKAKLKAIAEKAPDPAPKKTQP